MVVVRNDKKGEIVLTLLLEKKRIRKLILMFQRKMLQQGGISTLRTREEKPDKSDDDLGTYLSLNCCDMSSF